MCSEEELSVAVEDHEEPVEGLQEDLAVEEVVVVGQEVPPVVRLEQLVLLAVHGNWKKMILQLAQIRNGAFKTRDRLDEWINLF